MKRKEILILRGWRRWNRRARRRGLPVYQHNEIWNWGFLKGVELRIIENIEE